MYHLSIYEIFFLIIQFFLPPRIRRKKEKFVCEGATTGRVGHLPPITRHIETEGYVDNDTYFAHRASVLDSHSKEAQAQ